MRSTLLPVLLGGALFVFTADALAADPTTKPVDDGVIRPSISETDILKQEISKLKMEIVQLRKQIAELKAKEAIIKEPVKEPAKQPAKETKEVEAIPTTVPAIADLPEGTVAQAASEGRPLLGMTEATLEEIIAAHKTGGANKILQSQSPNGKIVKYDSTIYLFRVLIQEGRVTKIYEVTKKKSAIFDSMP